MLKKLSLFAVCFVACSAPVQAQIPSNYEDLRNWSTLGLPLAAVWNTGGYRFKYHADQVLAGRRFLPSIKLTNLVGYEGATDAEKLQKVQGMIPASAWTLLRNNRVPICLRADNISDIFSDDPDFRFPADASYIAQSPLTWRLYNGVLDQRKLPDCFGPASIWGAEGYKWGRSGQMKAFQQLLPNPTMVILLENNEGAYDEKLTRFVRYVQPPRKDELGSPVQEWLSPAELAAESLRMRDRVLQLKAADPNADPADFEPEYWTLKANQYKALFANFKGGLSAAWSRDFRTAGYGAMRYSSVAVPARAFNQFGYDPSLAYYDASSEGIYVFKNQYSDFTSLDHAKVLNLIPGWETARARNPKVYRELLLHMSDAGVYAGKNAGYHEVITPARYEGFVQWLLWSIHDPGVPVIMRHWCRAHIEPTTPMFTPDHFATLDALGAGSLKTATSETYVRPIISSVDRVTTNATLRNFWLRGRPVVVPGLGHPNKQAQKIGAAPYPQAGQPDNRWRVLECSVNPPRATWVLTGTRVNAKLKMWAVATRLDDSVLLFAWSPCNLGGRVNVTIPDFGTVSVDAPRPWSYWLVRRGSIPQRLSF